MFILTCLYAGLTLAILAAGATNEILGDRLTPRRRRDTRLRMLRRPAPRAAKMVA